MGIALRRYAAEGLIGERYLRRSRLRPPGEVSPAASERREGLFDVEVDAEEQERPKDDGQQR
jgi:hypothetical protein